MTAVPGLPSSPSEGLLGSRFNEGQLRRIARHLTLLKLAVERGHANRAQLRRFLTPPAYDQQFHATLTRFLGGPAPTGADLGPIWLVVATPDQAQVALAARETSTRWGAMRVDLRLVGGRLQATELLRAQDHWLVVPQTDIPAHTLGHVLELRRQLRLLLGERELTRAAAAATAARLDALPDGPRGALARAPLAPAAALWSDHAHRVDVELDALVRQLVSPKPPPNELTVEVAQQVLGPPPSPAKHALHKKYHLAVGELDEFLTEQAGRTVRVAAPSRPFTPAAHGGPPSASPAVLEPALAQLGWGVEL